MICPALSSIGLDQRALAHGAMMPELRNTHGMMMSEVDVFHLGKDESIKHMLEGGNGFTTHHYGPISAAVFDAGQTAEKRDLRSLIVWSQDLHQCRMDKARGVTS